MLGLPLHPLIVHAVVVVVPAAALAVLLAAVWPRFRVSAGWLPLALAVAAVVLTPLATSSGEPFEQRVGRSSLVEAHQKLGGMLIFWVVPLALLAVVLYLAPRVDRVRRPHWLVGAVTALSVVVALGTTVQVVLIGHSGAKAAWAGVGAQPAPTGGGEGGE